MKEARIYRTGRRDWDTGRIGLNSFQISTNSKVKRVISTRRYIMTRRKVLATLFIITGLMLATSPVFAQWHTDTRISNTASSSYSAYNSGAWSIAADNADVYIVWRDQSFTQYVRGVVFPIGTPPAPGSGTALSTGSVSYDVGVAAGDNTNAHVVWDYSSHQYYNGYNGSSWGSEYDHFYTGDNMRAQSIANNSAGTSFIVTTGTWNNPAFVYRIRYRERSAGGSWTPMTDIWAPPSTDYHYFVAPSICLTPTGTRHISMGIYRTAGPSYTIGHMWSPNGTSWSSEYVLPANSAYHVYPTSICSDKNGNIFIAYLSYPSPYQVRVIDNVGGSWNAPVTISNSTTSISYVSICSDTFGNVWVGWDQAGGAANEIFYAMRPAGGPWGTPQPLTANDGYTSRYINLTADKNGNVHASWTDNRDGNYEIYYNWFGGSSGPGPGGERDLACTRILQPVGKIQKGTIEPKAVIANLGEEIDSGYAKCFITGPGANYNKGNKEGIVYLDPGQEKEITFPDWEPSGVPGDQYRVEVVVYLWPEKTIADYDSTNNTKVAYATIASGTEVVATTVVRPEEGSTVDKMKPAAYFTNIGTDPAVNFYCHADITPGPTTAEYMDSVGVSDTLQPGDSTLIEFKDWICLDEAPFTAEFYVTGVDGALRIVNFNGTPWTGIAEKPYLYAPGLSISGTNINFTLPKAASVSLKVYDATGKLVSTLLEGSAAQGNHSYNLSAHSGVYFVKLVTPDYSAVRKVVIF